MTDKTIAQIAALGTALTTISTRLATVEAALFTSPANRRRQLGKRALAERYGCTPRTIDRRIKLGLLPPPDNIVGNRLFWWSDTLENHERACAATAAIAQPAAQRDPHRHAVHTTQPET